MSTQKISRVCTSATCVLVNGSQRANIVLGSKLTPISALESAYGDRSAVYARRRAADRPRLRQ